jgi:hypothetical protein
MDSVLTNSQKTLQKSTKNPQENQLLISFRKIINNNVIVMRKGGINSLGQLLFIF